jgi:hypothetical protein
MTNPGRARALACRFWRLAENNRVLESKVRDGGGAIASTRGRVRSPECGYHGEREKKG